MRPEVEPVEWIEGHRAVRESWALLAGRSAEVADAFYARLFELDPDLEQLFAVTDMESQAAKFTAMVAEVVRLVGDPDTLGPLLEESGRRHRGYGVRDRDYRTVGEALLDTLRVALGEDFTPAVRRAWAEALTRMAEVMRRAT